MHEIDRLPLVTIIIPTYNCSSSLPQTIESILGQDYNRYEIVAIDGGSTDRTLEILQSYGDAVRLASLETENRYALINHGIGLAHGSYVNVLFPSDFYIHAHTLRDIMELAQRHDNPHLAYCGTLLRDGRASAKFLFRNLTLELLQRGQQPTSLQGCWFKKETFDVIGLFSTKYELRGAFEWLCRFCLDKELRFAALHRALTDYDLRWVTGRMVMRHFWETLQVLITYFGWLKALRWLGRQKDFSRFGKLWARRLRVAFRGPRS